MIAQKSIERGWIEQVSKSYKADKILVEKAIRALSLLEGLAQSKLVFVFKGGTGFDVIVGDDQKIVYRY